MANPITRWLGGIRDGVVAWVQTRFLSTSSSVAQERPIRERDYGSYPARRGRYAVLWALYENTGYQAIHRWAAQFKVDFALYPNIRNVFNPYHRLVEFWATHTYTGTIDPETGDGTVRPSAIPIETRNESLRPVIGQILAASDWESNKTILARIGSAVGDVGIFAVDDTLNSQAYMEVIDPTSIVRYVADPQGQCQLYSLEEWRPDPRPGAVVDSYGEVNRVVYREDGVLERGDDGKPIGCRFSTYLDDTPFSWSDGSGEHSWVEPYPFVPFVLIAHVKILPKSPFGMSAGQAVLSKIREIDDVASRFGDFVAKAVDVPWLFAGVPTPTSNPSATGGPLNIPALYAGAEARAQALLSHLHLGHVDAHIKMLGEEIEQDLPEIRRDIENAVGDASGTALRVAQQRVETKGQSCRAGYDSATVRAIQFCIRISGIRGYAGFEEFSPEKIAADPKVIEFRVKDRPIFRKDILDNLSVQKEFWANAESADRAGVPIEAYLRDQGWSEERIAMVMKARDDAMEKGLPVGRAKQAAPPNEAAALAIQAPGGSAP